MLSWPLSTKGGEAVTIATGSSKHLSNPPRPHPPLRLGSAQGAALLRPGQVPAGEGRCDWPPPRRLQAGGAPGQRGRHSEGDRPAPATATLHQKLADMFLRFQLSRVSRKGRRRGAVTTSGSWRRSTRVGVLVGRAPPVNSETETVWSEGDLNPGAANLARNADIVIN